MSGAPGGQAVGRRGRITTSLVGALGLPDSYELFCVGQPVNLPVFYSSNATPYTVGMIGRLEATYFSSGARSACWPATELSPASLVSMVSTLGSLRRSKSPAALLVACALLSQSLYSW